MEYRTHILERMEVCVSVSGLCVCAEPHEFVFWRPRCTSTAHVIRLQIPNYLVHLFIMNSVELSKNGLPKATVESTVLEAPKAAAGEANASTCAHAYAIVPVVLATGVHAHTHARVT